MQHAPLGTFEEHVLLAVLRLADGAYGMAVRRCLEDATERDLAIGAVYATLGRLEAKELLTSQRREVEGRSRRLFEVSAGGVRALQATRAMRRRLWEGVQLPRFA